MQSWTSPTVPDLPGTGPGVRLHDTVSGELRATGMPATLYVCGITPYDATHLGHANTYVAFDLLVRAWRDAGLPVRYAQNVTDVDDPLLERAEEVGVDWEELAAAQVELFRSDMTALRVVPPDHYVGAVEAIPLIVDAVEGMLAAGVAYRVPTPADELADGGTDLGDVYADLGADPLFAVGPHLAGVDLRAVFGKNGGDPDRPGKRHPLDPLLWRRARNGEPAWDGGRLGRGRPGWHVECACIARHFLGDVVEVNGGGSDLIFPHHEMSESHLRTITGTDRPIVVHAHSAMVAVDGQKISKSLGNLVLVSGLVAEGHDPMAVRLLLLAHHYRTDWEYAGADLARAEARLQRWRAASRATAGPDGGRLLAAVRAALAEDLDAPAALAAVDAWAEAALAGAGEDRTAPGLVARTVDALLGVTLL